MLKKIPENVYNLYGNCSVKIACFQFYFTDNLHWLVKTCGATVETDLTQFGLDKERQSLIVTCSDIEDEEQEEIPEYNSKFYCKEIL